MKTTNSVLLALGSVLLMAGVAIMSSSSSSSLLSLRSTRLTAHKNAFFLGITITFIDVTSKAAFIELFTPYAEFVASNEPTTIGYELCQSDKNELQLFIIERYVTKEAYLDVHRKTQEFQEFRATLSKMSNVSCLYHYNLTHVILLPPPLTAN